MSDCACDIGFRDVVLVRFCLDLSGRLLVVVLSYLLGRFAGFAGWKVL